MEENKLDIGEHPIASIFGKPVMAEELPIPQAEWEFLYVINLYVDIKVPGLPMFEKDYRALAKTIDPGFDCMIVPPIVGVITKFDHQLTESELIEFFGGIAEALTKRHIDMYKEPELAHVERRVKGVVTPDQETDN